MHRRTLTACLLCASTLLSQMASAADELVDPAVVRNRLFTVAGRPELSLALGTSVGDGFTSHYTLGITGAYNVLESLALEVRLTLALGRHTGLASRAASDFLLLRDTALIPNADDLTNLWQMVGNLMAGVRWTPIYGKLSLFSETPVHFQAYASLGAGAGTFHRESLVYCLKPVVDGQGASTGSCSEWLKENRVAPLASAAVGMRLFVGHHGAVELEARDYGFMDQYRVNINREIAATGDRNQGKTVKSGLTQLWTINVGYAFLF